jgi:hypothetical protein
MARRRDPKRTQQLLEKMVINAELIERFLASKDPAMRERVKAEIDSRLSDEATLVLHPDYARVAERVRKAVKELEARGFAMPLLADPRRRGGSSSSSAALVVPGRFRHSILIGVGSKRVQ